MDLATAQAILDEAEALAAEGYSGEDYEVGLLRWPARPDKRASAEVWLAVRAITIGLGLASERARERT